jgi:antitoxin component YwqK of YwqJK toxin-antitoxin module
MYRSGRRHGWRTEWHENGQLKFEVFFWKGRPMELFRLFSRPTFQVGEQINR